MQLKASLKLSQQLRMTPQLQQAIKMLQLSRLELENEIRKEIDENPVLEEVMETMEDDPGAELSSVAQEKDSSSDDQDPQKQDEYEYGDDDLQYRGLSSSAPAEAINFDNFISVSKSLREHLQWQASLSGFNEEEMNLVGLIISHIDDNGYIKTPLAQIAEEEEIDVKELEEVLPFVQEFDPAGVGSRDLKECLILQAKHLEEDTKDVMHVIENHLKDMEKKNYEGIAKAMNLPIAEVIEICKIVLSFDPKPGRVFQSLETQYVTPDVYVYKVGDEYVVALNEDGLPKLRISDFYKSLLTENSKQSQNKSEKQTQDYIQEKLKSAVWLIKSIQQRQRTIYKVTESIVRHQMDFFEKGPAFIKPMILKDIANDIEMHESTVSRVTTNKYVHTARGIFELKYFFNSGISKTDGDSLASESVKLKIKDLVSQENSKKPLSDQKIVDLLKKDGIEIARRTVAKYRDMLGILPSSRRKKYF